MSGSFGLVEFLLVLALGFGPLIVGIVLIVWAVRVLSQLREDVAAIRQRLESMEGE